MDIETFKEELTSKLKDYAYLWQDELYIEDSHYHEYNDNVRHIMDSIGKEVESLALTVCNYFFGEGYEGSGSGGSGYDLINRKLGKGVEVKSCNLAQNVTCSCNRKYNPILFHACPTCGSKYLEMQDLGLMPRRLLDSWIRVLLTDSSSARWNSLKRKYVKGM